MTDSPHILDALRLELHQANTARLQAEHRAEIMSCAMSAMGHDLVEIALARRVGDLEELHTVIDRVTQRLIGHGAPSSSTTH